MTRPQSEEAGAEPGAARPAADPASEVEALRAELATLRDRHLRLQAEFENYRKRQQRERESANRHAKERLLRELPDVIDNLERALRHAAAPDAAPESLAQGVDLVARQLTEVLARFGAEPMTAVGAPFDPHRHEAMARVETSGDPPDGTVVEEFRRGWLLDGKVLRPALVAVAKVPGEGAGTGT
ncbi:MAG TPA: nucleotide exchange factor GrpE [bacterium]